MSHASLSPLARLLQPATTSPSSSAPLPQAGGGYPHPRSLPGVGGWRRVTAGLGNAWTAFKPTFLCRALAFPSATRPSKSHRAKGTLSGPSMAFESGFTRYCLTLGTLLASGFALYLGFRPLPTYAGLDICNQTGEDLYVSYAYTNDSTFESYGHYKVIAYQCRNLYGGNASAPGGSWGVFVLAKKGSNITHKGDSGICMNMTYAFEIRQKGSASFEEWDKDGESFHMGSRTTCKALGENYSIRPFKHFKMYNSYSNEIYDHCKILLKPGGYMMRECTW